jgi:hypothetical protein
MWANVLGAVSVREGKMHANEDTKTGIKAPLTTGEQGVVDKAVELAELRGYVMELHQCFRNAQSVLAADHDDPTGSKRLRYHEGYVPAPEGAAPHAWLTIDGKIVEITLRVSENYERLFEKIEYYAAETIAAELVLAYFAEAQKRGQYGSVRGLKGIPRGSL